MTIQRRNLSHKIRWWQRGFTLIELLVIVLLVGVFAAISGPSLGGMLDAAKVNKTVNDLRGSLQETQRQAIRKNKDCTLTIRQKDVPETSNDQDETLIQGDCLTSDAPEISEDVAVATNLAPTVPENTPSRTNPRQAPQEPNIQNLEISFGSLGGAEFSIESAVQAPNIPTDPSGKLVAFIPDKSNIQKKCVAVSSTLGLTRVGNYTGSTEPSAITDHGVCTALNWKEQ